MQYIFLNKGGGDERPLRESPKIQPICSGIASPILVRSALENVLKSRSMISWSKQAWDYTRMPEKVLQNC